MNSNSELLTWSVCGQQPVNRYHGRGGMTIHVGNFLLTRRPAVLSIVFLQVVRGQAAIFPARWYFPLDLYGRDIKPSNCLNLYAKLPQRSLTRVSCSPHGTLSTLSDSKAMLSGDAKKSLFSSLSKIIQALVFVPIRFSHLMEFGPS